MEIKVSQKRSKICQSMGLTPEQMAFADLIAVGWSVEDAWAMIIRQGLVWNKDQLKKEQQILAEKQQVKNRIESVQQVLRSMQTEKISREVAAEIKEERSRLLQQATSKESMLIDLQQSLKGMEAGTKEWLDVKKLIVEVSRMKQEEIKEEDTTVHFYLPVNYPSSCANCLLNPENQNKS